MTNPTHDETNAIATAERMEQAAQFLAAADARSLAAFLATSRDDHTTACHQRAHEARDADEAGVATRVDHARHQAAASAHRAAAAAIRHTQSLWTDDFAASADRTGPALDAEMAARDAAIATSITAGTDPAVFEEAGDAEQHDDWAATHDKGECPELAGEE